MTPQERQMVADLFDRLASLEGERRDPDAERVISEGLGRAPNAVYALVQSVLVQDEALKRANTRIEELEHAAGSASPPKVAAVSSTACATCSPGVARSPRCGRVARARAARVSSGAWGPRPDAPPPGYPPQGGYQQQPGYPPQGYPQVPRWAAA